MEDAIDIRLLPDEEIFSIIPLLRELNPEISEQTLQLRLREMVTQGYKCAGIYSERMLIGICGLWILTKYYVGKHVEPDNVFILPKFRSNGVGTKLMSWVYEYGKSQGCIASELNCYLSNSKGQIFWEKEGYQKIGYHYQKTLNS